MRRLACILAATLVVGCTQDAGRPRPETASPAMPARPATITRTDAEARAAIERRLRELGKDYRAVHVEVWQGRALLMGAVIKPEQRRKAETAARTTQGITQVFNELVLAEDAALALFVPDPARANLVRAATGNGPIVHVIHGVAFLLGQAGSAAEANSLKGEAVDVEGIKWVVAHLGE